MPQSATLLPTSSRVIAWPSASPISSPFGSSLPNRAWNDVSRGYRYGFNGKEKDTETANDAYDFGARIYDGRLGRWLSLDPLMKFFCDYSPYVNSFNCVLSFIDIDGLEPTPPLRYDFFNDMAITIFNAAKIRGASVKGALLILSQAANESGYGSQNKKANNSKKNDYNIFGLMAGKGQPSSRKTSHGSLIDFSTLGGYKGCVDYYFDIKLKNQWPQVIEIIKKKSFTSDDLNRAFYTYNYYENPEQRKKTKHNSYHGSDEGSAWEIDYGKNVIDGISTTIRLWTKVIDYDIAISQNKISTINDEIDKLKEDLNKTKERLLTFDPNINHGEELFKRFNLESEIKTRENRIDQIKTTINEKQKLKEEINK